MEAHEFVSNKSYMAAMARMEKIFWKRGKNSKIECPNETQNLEDVSLCKDCKPLHPNIYLSILLPEKCIAIFKSIN